MLQLHIGLNGKKEARELACGLRSGVQEALALAIGTSHMLMEGPQVPLAKLKNLSPFLASRNFPQAPEETGTRLNA